MPLRDGTTGASGTQAGLGSNRESCRAQGKATASAASADEMTAWPCAWRAVMRCSFVIDRFKVLIISDHPALLDGLRMIFGATADLEIVCTIEDVSTLASDLDRLSVDVAVVDLELRRRGALRALRTLQSMVRTTPVVLLVNYLGDPTIIALIDQATHGQITRVSKSVTGDELVVAVKAAADRSRTNL